MTGTSDGCAAALHTLWADPGFTTAQDNLDAFAEGIFHNMLGAGNHSLVECDTGHGEGTCLIASGDWGRWVPNVVTDYRKAGDNAFDGTPNPGINTVVNGVIIIRNMSRPLRMRLYKMTRLYVPDDCCGDLDVDKLNDLRKQRWERSPSVISANFSLSYHR